LSIRDFGFAPLTVRAGATVTVTNADSTPHTVTATDASFQVAVPAGGTASFVAPSSVGTTAFFCEIHPSMTGQLTTTS
jgi:plastocyanin